MPHNSRSQAILRSCLRVALFGAFVLVLGPAAAQHASPLAGRHVAVKVLSACPADPDPVGIVSSDMYSSCEQDELDKVKNWIVSALMSAHSVASVGDDNPDVVLSVTITKDMDDRGVGGMITDFAPGTLEFAADYRIVDAAGHVLQSGTVSHEGSDSEDADAVEQQFAEKIAAAAVSSSGVAPAAGDSSRPVPQPPTPPSGRDADTQERCNNLARRASGVADKSDQVAIDEQRQKLGCPAAPPPEK